MKKTFILMMLALMYLSGTLIAQDIVFVTPDGRDSVNVDWLNDQGYNVTVWFPTDGFATAPQSDIDMLNAADLIILGRSCPSTTFQAPHKKRWNDLTAPILSINMWGARSSRINWFNSTATSQITTPVDDTLYAWAVDPTDPVWAGVTLVGDSLPWARIPEDNIADVNPTNGTVVAEDGDIKYVVRWDPFNEFYPGSGDRPQGFRTYFGMGNDSNGDTAHFFTLTDVAKTVYKAEIDRLIGLEVPQNIIFITPDGRDSVNIDFLNSMGYPVRSFWVPNNLTNQDTIDFLNSADLLIYGRSCPSTTFQAPYKETWNSLKSPALSINMWGSRSSRINWFNSTATAQITTPVGDSLYAIAVDPTDPVWAGVTLVGDSLPWARIPEDNISDVNENNGTVVAENGDIKYDVRWDPYVPFYPGTIDKPMGYRTYFGMGNDSNGDTAHFFTLTEMAQSVYMAEIDRLLDMGKAGTFVIVVSPDGRDSAMVDALIAEGYNVDVFFPNQGLSATGADTIAYLNSADVIVVGRSCPSSTFQAPDKAYWNALKAPIMWINQWGARSSRVNMFNSTTIPHIDTPAGDTLYANILAPTDDVFSDATIVGDSMPWQRLPEDYLIVTESTNGTVLASDDSIMYMVRFDPLDEYYADAGDYPSGYRTYMGMGNDATDTAHFWSFTDMAKSVFFKEIDRLAALPDPALSNDADLMSLEASEGTLVPDFDPAVTEYTLDVTGATVTLTAMAHPNASVTGDGEVDAPGTATITVTADNGATQDYVVTITSGGGTVITEIVVVGDATPNGWNMPSTEPMTQDATNASIFTWEGLLIGSVGEGNLKFATYNTSDWCGQWILATALEQPVEDASGYQLYQGCPPTEEDLKWHVTTEGIYLITIDVENETIEFELLTGIIDNEYSDISVYPNPATSSITMVNAENLSYVAIFNLAGEKVLDLNVENANGIAEIDISDLPSGFYLIRAYEEDNLVGIGKFTKQ